MAGFQLGTVQTQVAASPLPAALRKFSSGPFGLTSLATQALESISVAADAGLEASRVLEDVILKQLREHTSAPGLVVPTLDPSHRALIGAFQVVVTADFFADWSATITEPPNVQGGLELDGLESLLSAPSEQLLTRLIDIAAGFLQRTATTSPTAVSEPTAVLKTLTAGLALLKNSVVRFSQSGSMASLETALHRHALTVGSLHYRGLSRLQRDRDPSEGLLDIRVEDIVGNTEYLDAAKRLARDVAGYDLETQSNPKKVNPILFALGRPGCGKTVTAHAIGRYFLDYCKERGVPAKFLVIRRSDWASSYQNASASNLIRLFEEQVMNFEGVCGIYWPDIDTALASRDSGKLRSEEKQNLGAVFGVFDGTILPKDGSWFMMCDANTMHMDEAAISRIAQNPMTVAGATTPEDYARMMRDVCLRDVRAFLPTDDEEWLKLGQLAQKRNLSGRNVEAICGNVRAAIQDFEYPPEYFQVNADARKALVEKLSTTISFADFASEVEDFAKFQLDASRLDEEKAFERDVEELVRQLNASRAAAASLTASTGD